MTRFRAPSGAEVGRKGLLGPEDSWDLKEILTGPILQSITWGSQDPNPE